ncbi:fructosamine kinase family protein [Alkalibacillus aidingensis]|uniref:fructosamine kinase family protein n=1 Tax=Alkalibacillus aidingensis TaxID=2747607 RepID=UPI001CB6F4ED|nr:fructosamine kinase family protein [Alkalibacillus aidingensis]
MIRKIITEALQEVGDFTNIKKVEPVHGGEINQSYYVETDEQQYFLKYNPDAPKDFFRLEVEGLRLIKSTNTVNVPHVITYLDQPGKSILMTEWIEGRSNTDTEYLLGEQLAKLHQTYAKQHGFKEKTYIGTLPQKNDFYDEWVDYYRDKRLIQQYRLGVERGLISGERQKGLQQLMDQLHKWIPTGIKPSYLHGDFWGGNWLTGPKGEPYVIDPSFLYGDRHFELAFTELFGGFSKSFYRGYNSILPEDGYYPQVKKLYQLYYLLVHLNIFGEMYGSSVDSVIKEYRVR